MKLHHLTSTLLLASLFTAIKGQCETELSTLNACTGTDILDDTAMACHLCVINAPFWYVNGVYSCDDLQLAYCTAVDLCMGPETCGACIDQMEPLVGCILNDYYSSGILGGCELVTCGTTDQATDPPTDTTTEPPTDPTNEFPGVDVMGQCPTELSDLWVCFPTTDCYSCLENALNTMPSSSCGDVQNSLCSALGSCNCGSCTDKAEAVFDCIADSLSCQLDDCGRIDPDSSGGTSVGSFTTILLSLASLLWV